MEGRAVSEWISIYSGVTAVTLRNPEGYRLYWHGDEWGLAAESGQLIAWLQGSEEEPPFKEAEEKIKFFEDREPGTTFFGDKEN